MSKECEKRVYDSVYMPKCVTTSQYLNLVRVDFEGDGGVSGDVGDLLVVIFLVELLVELADVVRHCAVSRRRPVATLAYEDTTLLYSNS